MIISIRNLNSALHVVLKKVKYKLFQFIIRAKNGAKMKQIKSNHYVQLAQVHVLSSKIRSMFVTMLLIPNRVSIMDFIVLACGFASPIVTFGAEMILF